MWSVPCTPIPPTYKWFDVKPAASAAGVVVAWCVIALAPEERSPLTVSDYRQASVQVEWTADGECGGWLGCGNCTIAQLLKRASRKSGADLGWLRAPSFRWLAADWRQRQWRTTRLMSQHVADVPFRRSVLLICPGWAVGRSACASVWRRQDTARTDSPTVSNANKPEWSNWHGSESSSLETDVYVWCYPLLVVYDRNNDDESHIMNIQSEYTENIW